MHRTHPAFLPYTWRMISVITPTYLTPPEMFLRTYQSLLSQTHTDWEWVIIDDSPTDRNETWEMVRTYASRDARIRAFRPDRHSGSIGRNKRWGFMLAEGDILVELDHDDEMLPTCLAKVLAAFQANPATGFVYSDWAELLPDGQSTVYPEGWGFGYATTYWTDSPAPGRPGMWTMGTAPMNATTLRHIVSMPNHVRAWRASVYRDMNGHDPRYEVCDDYQLMVRTFLHTQFHHIPELLYLQHISPTSAQRQRNQAIQAYVGQIAEAYDEAITKRLEEIETGSPLNVWDRYYADLTPDKPGQYGDATTYRIAAAFLSTEPLVEDWGCGAGGMSQFITPSSRYRGIDGSRTPFAAVTADLATYEQPTPAAIVMRHVLEHNYGWEALLDNAVRQFRNRMCLILFTPLSTHTHLLHHEADYDNVPVISFDLSDITSRLPEDVAFTVTHHSTFTQFGTETVLYLTRRTVTR